MWDVLMFVTLSRKCFKIDLDIIVIVVRIVHWIPFIPEKYVVPVGFVKIFYNAAGCEG